jgi:hypothetical protein
VRSRRRDSIRRAAADLEHPAPRRPGAGPNHGRQTGRALDAGSISGISCAIRHGTSPRLDPPGRRAKRGAGVVHSAVVIQFFVVRPPGVRRHRVVVDGDERAAAACPPTRLSLAVGFGGGAGSGSCCRPPRGRTQCRAARGARARVLGSPVVVESEGGPGRRTSRVRCGRDRFSPDDGDGRDRRGRWFDDVFRPRRTAVADGICQGIHLRATATGDGGGDRGNGGCRRKNEKAPERLDEVRRARG